MLDLLSILYLRLILIFDSIQPIHLRLTEIVIIYLHPTLIETKHIKARTENGFCKQFSL